MALANVKQGPLHGLLQAQWGILPAVQTVQATESNTMPFNLASKGQLCQPSYTQSGHNQLADAGTEDLPCCTA